MAKKSTTKVSRRKKAPTKKKVKAAKKSRKPIQKEEQRDNCFTMMPFSDPFNTYYAQLYKPAIEDTGLRPVRADDLFRPGIIVADLWGMIRDAKVLLAELTTKNANVFYELGLAHAIGKPIILISETLNDVPFDLQQLRVLLYNKDDPTWGDKLIADITRAIKETLKAPIEAVPNIFRKRVESQAPKQDALASRLEAVETQMQSIRVEQVRDRRSRLMKSGPEGELESVMTFSDFKEWVRRWHEKLPVSVLRTLVGRSELPSSVMERISEIIEEI